LFSTPPKGGNLQRSFNLLKEVAKENQVFLLTFNQKFYLPTSEMVKKSVEKLKEHCDYVQVFDIPYEKHWLAWFWLLFTNLFSVQPYSVKKFWCPRMLEAINVVINTRHIDLVHFDTVALAQYSICVRGTRKSLNHHNVESMLLWRMAQREKNLFKKLYLYLQSKKLRKYERETMGRFELNLAVS
jgi:hypothetical protein